MPSIIAVASRAALFAVAPNCAGSMCPVAAPTNGRTRTAAMPLPRSSWMLSARQWSRALAPPPSGPRSCAVVPSLTALWAIP
eukprot:6419703-Pyramimonas_sp.AAC.1